jgi:hypothetical protein
MDTDGWSDRDHADAQNAHEMAAFKVGVYNVRDKKRLAPHERHLAAHHEHMADLHRDMYAHKVTGKGDPHAIATKHFKDQQETHAEIGREIGKPMGSFAAELVHEHRSEDASALGLSRGWTPPQEGSLRSRNREGESSMASKKARTAEAKVKEAHSQIADMVRQGKLTEKEANERRVEIEDRYAKSEHDVDLEKARYSKRTGTKGHETPSSDMLKSFTGEGGRARQGLAWRKGLGSNLVVE